MTGKHRTLSSDRPYQPVSLRGFAGESAWHDLIHNLAEHCADRYGKEEASTWYWELWNEPDLAYYWNGTIDEYCKLYDYTATAVKAVLDKAQIGGPATTHHGHDWLDKFLDHCVNGTNHLTGMRGSRLDFISFHSKGTGYRPLWGRSSVEKQLPSSKRLLSQVVTGLDIIERYPSLKGKRCILSECDPDGMAAYGVSDNPNLNFRNTEYYPSYVVVNFKKLADIEDDYGREIDALTWAFTFHGERCFEGTRSFTTNDVQKPLLNLFEMYSMLGDVRVQLTSSGAKNPMLYRDCCDVEEKTDIDGIAAISGNKSIVFLLYCHNDDWDAEGEYKIYVEATNLPFKGSDGRLEHYRLDKDHSNAHAEWVRQGRPDYPTPSQNAVIKSSENLELLEPETYVTLTDGKFKKIISIPVNGISLLRLSSE